MPTLDEYLRDYHAPDRDFVISNIQRYGTDDRSQWGGVPTQQNNVVSNPQNLTRDQYRDKWMSSDPMTWEQMNQWLAQNGGQMLSGNGTVRTPFGDVLDMGYGARAAQAGNGLIKPFWTRIENQGGNQQPMGSYSGMIPQNPTGNTGIAGGMFYNQIMPQMAQGSRQLNPTSNYNFSGANEVQQFNPFVSRQNQQANPFVTNQSQINRQPSSGSMLNTQQSRMRDRGFSGFRVS